MKPIRRDKQGDLCDFWHRMRWGIAVALLIFLVPIIMEVIK